jgi:hypothetical protein
MQKNKALVSIVLVLGLVILIGLALLGYGIFKTANNPNFKFFKSAVEKPNNNKKAFNVGESLNPSIKKNILIKLAKEEWVHGVTTSMNKVLVHITNKNKEDRLLILNADNGSIIRQIKFQRRQ